MGHWGRRKGGLRGPVVAGVAVVVGIVAVSRLDLLPSLPNPLETERVDRTQPAILEALEDVSRYTAATGNFQVLVDVEDDSRYLPDFLQGERVLFNAAGTVDATVDFSRLDQRAIEVTEGEAEGGTVRVTLPPAELTEPRIDPEGSRIVTQDRGILDRVGGAFTDTPTSERDLFLLAEEDLANAAAESDLLERAEQNTTTFLEGLLGSLGYDDVTVVFEPEGGEAPT